MASVSVTPAGSTPQLLSHQPDSPHRSPASVSTAPVVVEVAPRVIHAEQEPGGAGRSIWMYSGLSPVAGSRGQISGGMPGHTTLPPASR